MKVIALTWGDLDGTLKQGIKKTFPTSNLYREIWLNVQKSVQVIVPSEPTEKIG
jgi:hypothetical protein